MTPGLSGRSAFVSGATSGLGRAVAVHLHEQGASDVFVHGRSQDKLEGLVAEHADLTPVLGDLATEEGCRAVEDAIASGAPDCLVLNAGEIGPRGPANELQAAEAERVVQVNLLAPMRLAAAFARLPAADAYRRLVLVLSTSCFYPRPGLAAYVATKTGLMGFGRVLQQEMHDLRLRTTLVYPGRMDTGIRADVRSEYTSPESAAQALGALLGLPEDLVPYEFTFRPPPDTRI